MQNASFNFGKNLPLNELKVAAQNGQPNTNTVDEQKQQQQLTSIFNKNHNAADVNQFNNNSHGTGGVDNIFTGGGFTPAGMDNTSIFSGINRGSNYALYSKKDYSYDVPKLTKEDIAAQKAAEGPKRVNPKPYNIDMTPKANPYEAFRNPEMPETSISDALGNMFSNLFGQKKAD